ncbi:hypothetical protein L6452_42312 [Arctium lappa]|uniref:Uncharacterized protein n=1 Tax=Arctium lappa TaxID=4217 RepID=A0ACB8XJ50_ARCLA|nr:hypothetical protein L6452_42312 [Arctium lappa]
MYRSLQKIAGAGAGAGAGQYMEEVSFQLILRVVADVGLVAMKENAPKPFQQHEFRGILLKQNAPAWCLAPFDPEGLLRLRSNLDIENVGEEFSCWQHYGVDLHNMAPSSVEDFEAASIEKQEFGLKPMNCPGHCLIFDNRRPEKYLGDLETWNRVEDALADALNEFGKPKYFHFELIAHSHDRGVIRKHLLPLKFLNEAGKGVYPCLYLEYDIFGRRSISLTLQRTLEGRG